MTHDLPVEGIALDIDETLADTNRHWVRELTALFGKPDDLSFEDIVRHWRYVERLPHWQTPEAFAWMDNARTSNEAQEKIPLIENADRVVERIRTIVPIAAYITARPECVRGGTLQWLSRHNFPKAPLLMRPTELPHGGSSEWKAKLLASLYPKVVGIVDDNPGLIEYLPSDYQGTIFLYDHPEVEDRGLRVVRVPTWDHVFPAVSQALS